MIMILNEISLTMNQFPGWVDEEDWQKIFDKKVKDIDCIWLKYSSEPNKLKTKTVGSYVKYLDGDIGNSIMIGKSNLQNGIFSATIDKASRSAVLRVGGEFEVDTTFMDAKELKALKSHKHIYVGGFTFSDAKGRDTNAQGHFTDDWDHYVAINVQFK